MKPRLPAVSERLALGVGLDLRYGDAHGFEFDPARGDRLAARVRTFLQQRRADFGYAFFSFQPGSRSLLAPERYFPTWDALFEDVPRFPVVGLHHTMLNLGTIDRTVDRTRLIEVTNALIQRYGLAWINEDLGIWSIEGKLLPYPLPPLMTEAGLSRCIDQVGDVMSQLAAPLLLEFPGFSEGTNFFVGRLHAYDYFRRIAEQTGVAVTLDTGHLISYQWLLGRRGEALFEDLDRLPLENCFEIHCSGCQIVEDRYVDVHHGVLHEAQLELLDRLLARCPNVRCVAYEDPKVDPDGALRSKARPGFNRLRSIVERWRGEGEPRADLRASA